MLDHYFGTYHCHQLTTEMLETWFADREWKRITIEGVIAKIGPFFNWCKREMIIIRNPLKYIILPKKMNTHLVFFPHLMSPNCLRQLEQMTRV